MSVKSWLKSLFARKAQEKLNRGEIRPITSARSYSGPARKPDSYVPVADFSSHSDSSDCGVSDGGCDGGGD